MKHYCETIPVTLAEKLKEKGMPMEEGGKSMIDWKAPTYADTIDWFMSEKNKFIDVHPSWETGKVTYKSAALPDDINAEYYTFSADTWHEAANAAIEKALTLI